MPEPNSPPAQSPQPRSEAEIRDWLIAKLSAAAQLDPSEIQGDAPLIGLGLDSMQFVVLVGELEDWLGCRFTDNPLMDYPTIDALAPFLADRIARGQTSIDPTER